MVWTDDESELLLNVTLEYKVAKAAENVDWESVRSKYQDILDRMKAQLPANAEEARQLLKDYPHTKDQVSKQALTSKLKAVRSKYRHAVDSGRRSGHGRVVLLYFELCEKIWGGSPATEQIDSGIESIDHSAHVATNEGAESRSTGEGLADSQPVCDNMPTSANSQSSTTPSSDSVQQRRALLNDKLSNYKQAKLKRKLPAESQLVGCVKEDIALKKRMIEQMETMDKKHQEQMQKMSDSLEKLTNSISGGFDLLRHMLAPPQPMHPQSMYPHHSPFPQSYPPTLYGQPVLHGSSPPPQSSVNSLDTSSSSPTTPQSPLDDMYYA